MATIWWSCNGARGREEAEVFVGLVNVRNNHLTSFRPLNLTRSSEQPNKASVVIIILHMEKQTQGTKIKVASS